MSPAPLALYNVGLRKGGLVRLTGIILFLALSAGIIAGCAQKQPSSDGRLHVLASIFPVADVVAQVGGENVTAISLLEPGMDPHAFSPKPSDAEALMRSRLLVTVGMGIDQWANRAADRARTAKVTILTLTDDPDFRRLLDSLNAPAGDDASMKDEHSASSSGDPHVWLDPAFMQIFTSGISRALARLDPEHTEAYRRRADGFIAVLKQLDDEYRTQLAAVRNRDFVTFHQAFYYICRRYGLREYALEDADAQGFGPEQYRRLQAAVREHHIRAIFAEPQFDSQRLESLAAGTGATVGRIDDLGNPGVKGYDSYVAMMRSNLAALVNALKE